MIRLLDFQSFLQENYEEVARPDFWNSRYRNHGHGVGFAWDLQSLHHCS